MARKTLLGGVLALAVLPATAKIICRYEGLGNGGLSPLDWKCRSTCVPNDPANTVCANQGLKDAAEFILDDYLPTTALVINAGDVNSPNYQDLDLYTLINIIRLFNNPFCPFRTEVYVYATYVYKIIELVSKLLSPLKKIPVVKNYAIKIDRFWQLLEKIPELDEKLKKKCDDNSKTVSRLVERILSKLSFIVYMYGYLEHLLVFPVYEAICGFNNALCSFKKFLQDLNAFFDRNRATRHLQYGEPENGEFLTRREVHDAVSEALSQVGDPHMAHMLKKWSLLRSGRLRKTPLDEINVQLNSVSEGRRLALVDTPDMSVAQDAVAYLQDIVSILNGMNTAAGPIVEVFARARAWIDEVFAESGFFGILGRILEPISPVFDIFEKVIGVLEYLTCPEELGWICDIDTIIEGAVKDILASFGLDVDALIDEFIDFLEDILNDLGIPTGQLVDEFLPDLGDLDVVNTFVETYIDPLEEKLDEVLTKLDFDPIDLFFDSSGDTDFSIGSSDFEFLYSSTKGTTTSVQCDTAGEFPVVLKAWRRTAVCGEDIFTARVVTPCGFDGSTSTCNVDGGQFGNQNCNSDLVQFDVSQIPGFDSVFAIDRVSAWYICATVDEFFDFGLLPIPQSDEDAEFLQCGVGEVVSVEAVTAFDPCDTDQTLESGWGGEWFRYCQNKSLEEPLSSNSNFERKADFLFRVKETRDAFFVSEKDRILAGGFSTRAKTVALVQSMENSFVSQFRDVCNWQGGSSASRDGSISAACDGLQDTYLLLFDEVFPVEGTDPYDTFNADSFINNYCPGPTPTFPSLFDCKWYEYPEGTVNLVDASRNPYIYYVRGRPRWIDNNDRWKSTEGNCLNTYEQECNDIMDECSISDCSKKTLTFRFGSDIIFSTHNVHYTCLIDGRDIGTAGTNNFIAVGLDVSEVTLECPTSGSINVLNVEVGDGGFENKRDVTFTGANGLQSSNVSTATLGVNARVFRIEYECYCNAPTEPIPVYDNVTDTYTCEPCDPGTYRGNGMGDCEQCSAGTFSNSSTGSLSCTGCPEGTFQPNVGSAGCVDCPPGTYSNLPAQTSQDTCLPCPVNEYNDEPAQTSCKPTPAGKETVVMGSKAAFDVGLGSYSILGGPATPCEVGTFSNVPGAQDECTPCPPGSFSSRQGAEICEPCPIDTYANTTNSILCESCPNGTGTNTRTGRTSIDECEAPPEPIDYLSLSEATCEELLMLDVNATNATELDIILERRLGQIGNGFCNQGPWNTPQCSYDGGDCCCSSCTIPPDVDNSSVAVLETLCSQSTFFCIDPDEAGKACSPSSQGVCVSNETDSGVVGLAGDGVCDENLNNANNSYDGGDCCWWTCTKTTDPASCQNLDCCQLELDAATDTTPPQLLITPPIMDQTVEVDELDEVVVPVVSASDSDVGYSGFVNTSVNRIDGDCPNSFSLVWTWAAEDPSGNAATAEQVVTVVDTKPPLLLDEEKRICFKSVPVGKKKKEVSFDGWVKMPLIDGPLGFGAAKDQCGSVDPALCDDTVTSSFVSCELMEVEIGKKSKSSKSSSGKKGVEQVDCFYRESTGNLHFYADIYDSYDQEYVVRVEESDVCGNTVESVKHMIVKSYYWQRRPSSCDATMVLESEVMPCRTERCERPD